MIPEQERILKTFVELRWVKGAKGELIARGAGLGSDYTDFLCQDLCKQGYLESESEGEARLYRITVKGREALKKATPEKAASRDFRRPHRITSWGSKDN